MRALTYDEMEAKFIKKHPNHRHSDGGKLCFEGVWKGAAPHNPSAPVWLQVRPEEKERLVMAVRFEPTEEKMTSVIHFCEQSDTDESVWHPIPLVHARAIGGEDPFITTIHGEIIVATKYALPVSKGFGGSVPCCTVLFKGKTLTSLKMCSVWNEVNCARPIELRSGKIGVFTRTRNEVSGHCVLEWRVVEKIQDISPEGLARVDMIELNVFAHGEWGSVNEPNLCSDGTITAIGHVAKHVTKDDVKYAIIELNFDPETGEHHQPTIIATRESFLDGKAKSKRVSNVAYPAGIRFIDGRAILYAGTSAAEVQTTDVTGRMDFH